MPDTLVLDMMTDPRVDLAMAGVSVVEVVAAVELLHSVAAAVAAVVDAVAAYRLAVLSWHTPSPCPVS
jgi:hypothetical protein